MAHSGSARRRVAGERMRCAVRALTVTLRRLRPVRREAVCETLEPRRILSGSISGTVFKDVNSNGSLDSGDPGISGVTVYLDIDATNSPTPADTTTTTDTNGAYTFPSVADGTYSIGEVTPAGVVRVGPIFISATVAGNSVTGKNLANFPHVFAGGNGSDMWTIRMDAASGTRVEILETLLGKPTVTWSIIKSSIPSITINANSGDDVIAIDYASGNPLPPGGINIDGSTQTLNGDRVTVTGGGAADVITISNLDDASGAGLIAIKNVENATVNGGPGNDSINLRVGMPIPIACDGQGGMDTLTFSGSDGVNLISVTPTVVGDQTVVHPYAQLELLEIKSGDGPDRVDINDASCAASIELGAGNDEMIVNIATVGSVGVLGGDEDDKLTLLQDIWVPVNFTGGNGADSITVGGSNANDAINITASTVTPQGALFTVTYSAESLCVDAADGDDAITANLGASTTPVTVLGGAGNDALTSSSGAWIVFDDSVGTNTATFNTSSSNETISLSGITIVTPGRALMLLGSVGCVINALGGQDTINLASFSATGVTVNGGDGNDVFTISDPAPPGTSFNGGLNGADVDTLNVNAGTYTFAADAQLSSANLVVNVGSAGWVNFNATQHLKSLTVTGHATLSAGGAKVLRTKSLNVSGWLDLKDNDLIVDYETSSPIGSWNGGAYTGVTGMIQSGMNGGEWNGNGLMSSSTGDMATAHTGLGCAEATEILGIGPGQTEVWSGETVDHTCVLVKFTYRGDFDLNGEINGDDYFFLDSNILNSGAVFGYHNGDLDLNGELNGDDYFFLDSNIVSASVIL
jgi:hypothetical protein